MTRTILAAGILFASFTTAYSADATRLVTSAAKAHGVPVHFALRIAKIESGVKCGRRNPKSSASGPLQVLKGTARGLGYKGDIRRASCAVQTNYGVKHLAMCWRGARGNAHRAAACHYQGVSALKRVNKAGAAYARKAVR
jgi:soluble lytic murein transglycosylase-like protein